VPKPCSSPLTPNPFETYRDPDTGRWLVRYPATTLPVNPLAAGIDTICRAKTEEDALKRFSAGEAAPVRKIWETPPAIKWPKGLP